MSRRRIEGPALEVAVQTCADCGHLRMIHYMGATCQQCWECPAFKQAGERT